MEKNSVRKPSWATAFCLMAFSAVASAYLLKQLRKGGGLAGWTLTRELDLGDVSRQLRDVGKVLDRLDSSLVKIDESFERIERTILH